jgi:signal transduction histidine kinase
VAPVRLAGGWEMPEPPGVRARGLGAGFLNMADRLGALGGSLRVESAPQRGTTVSGTIPVNADADAG